MFTIYSARKIITMNPARPTTTHVAVRDGNILGTGTLQELTDWGEHRIDDRFSDMFLMPGLIEGHAHTMEGTLWRHAYCGYFDRVDPDGKVWTGLKNKDQVIDRLKEASAALTGPDTPLPGWQLDPIYFEHSTITRQDLDEVSTTRPIGVLHASVHTMNVNSKALELAGLLRPGIEHPGIPLGDDGLPNGTLRGPEAMSPVSIHVGFDRDFLACDEIGLRAFGRLCVRAGVTTVTDLAAYLGDKAVSMMTKITAEEQYPARVVPLRYFQGLTPEELIQHVLTLKTQSTDKLRLGIIKIVVDGSIQGFTARLRTPGYFNGAPNGLWYVAPEQLQEIYDRALETGLQVHTHTNGDEATQLALETLERALTRHPVPDHRFTIQHGQLADATQFQQMAKLGMCANLFANHTFYWGDQHYALTVGPERAERMNACATALDKNVPLAIHSDAPITPLAPLFTAWCAVNRLTATGRTQGETEKISVADALRTITMGAAYTLKLDAEVGSIQAGKRADFAVLLDDPTTISADMLKDVRVWGTVHGGRPCAVDDL